MKEIKGKKKEIYSKKVKRGKKGKKECESKKKVWYIKDIECARQKKK